MLHDFWRHGDALVEIEKFAPVMAEVNGARHPETLRARRLKASVLEWLGRYQDALVEIDDFAPAVVEVRGARHPEALTTRCLRASVLKDLGRYGDALRGARHPHSLMTRNLRAVCLANSARWDQALSEIEGVYLAAAETLGASGAWTLSFRSSRIGIEIAAELDVDSAGELREIIGVLTVTNGPSDMATLFARYRLSRFLLQRGHADQARAEIADTIAHFDPMTEPDHRLFRSAKALRNAIEGHSVSETLIV